MRKAFGFILTVVLAMSLIGCSDKKATTTEVTSTEVKATVTEAPTTEVPTTKATVSDATATDATAISASSTDATVPEASANDAEKLSTSNEITENVVMTENVNQKQVLHDMFAGDNKKIILGYYGDVVFAIYVADEGSDDIEVILTKHCDDTNIQCMFTENNVADTSLLHQDLTSGFKGITDGIVEFSVTYTDGKTVNVTVHVPEA